MVLRAVTEDCCARSNELWASSTRWKSEKPSRYPMLAIVSVRWAAAEALAKLGAPAVREILRQIAQRVLTEEACQAACHALQQLAPVVNHHRLQPLLEALRSRQAPNEAPPIADELLQTKNPDFL